LGDDALAERLGLSVSDGYTRTSLLGLLAVKEALASAGISDMKSATTALISSTTVGGMRNTEMIYHELLSPNLREEYINFLNSHDLGESTERIADYFGVKDFVTTISTACSSSANAIILGARLIKHGIVDRAICGGTDTLSKFTINGFNSLMILDKEHSRPFDDSRVGLNLGEGAGYIIL
jgi:3-oxoacyl-[acyl-carrier-protein] synthase-1